jgi:hypothetical protein
MTKGNAKHHQNNFLVERIASANSPHSATQDGSTYSMRIVFLIDILVAFKFH